MMLNVEVREDKKQDRSTKEALLWKSYRRKATREESEAGLVEQYLPLVKTVVGRLQMSLPSHVDAEDLYSAGLVGLLDAIRHYNPKLGSTFETYAPLQCPRCFRASCRIQKDHEGENFSGKEGDPVSAQ